MSHQFKFKHGILILLLIFQALIWIISNNSDWVETYYSRGFYGQFAQIMPFLIDWIPFSIGDIFYIFVFIVAIMLLAKIVFLLFKKQWGNSYSCILNLLILSLSLYLFFHISWGLNYYRNPLAQTYDLRVENETNEDYYKVLSRYIDTANNLRKNLVLKDFDRSTVKTYLENRMKASTPFDLGLSKTHVKSKSPISSTLASYFMVSGYFNPFTHETQVNTISPIISYPFTTVHELAHQMSIGFEDECNFIAFRMLEKDDKDFYRYSAYYEAVKSLLWQVQSMNEEKHQFFMGKLSLEIMQDFQTERQFWSSRTGYIEAISRSFYNYFLKHNNQPEGMTRYSMMNQLIIAWELKGRP